MDAGSQIAAAMNEIELEDQEEQRRQQFKAATKVLREIQNGTPDSELTREQVQAWKDYNEVMRWFDSTAMREP